MSWKFAGISFVKDYQASYPDLLKRLGVHYYRSSEGFTFSDAIRHDNLGTALGVINGKTMLLNHLLPYDCSYEPGKEGRLDEILKSLSIEGTILTYIVDGVSRTYCFSLFSHGERVRRWGTEPGNVWVDEGQPIDGEPAMALRKPTPDDFLPGIFAVSDDEAHLFAVWEAFMGVSFQQLVQDNSPIFHLFS
jgi:hypothetical protein